MLLGLKNSFDGIRNNSCTTNNETELNVLMMEEEITVQDIGFGFYSPINET